MEIGVTKFKHKTFGEGLLIGIKEDVYVIDFGKKGVKNISKRIDPKYMFIIDDKGNTRVIPSSSNNNNTEYDNSQNSIGGKNVLSFEEMNTDSTFNESYVLLGESVKVNNISATYNLTIIGDISADSINVKRKLFVDGNITANRIICNYDLYCSGNITSDYLEVGTNLTANEIKCNELICDGNISVAAVLDIDGTCKCEGTVFSGEGVIGAGVFSSKKAVTNDYFDFNGKVSADIIELEEQNYENRSEVEIVKEQTLEMIINSADQKYINDLKTIASWDEEACQAFAKLISDSSIAKAHSLYEHFSTLVDMSYKNKIQELKTYLLLKYAVVKLPNEFSSYETVEHIKNQLLPDAEKDLIDMEFFPENTEDVAIAIRIVNECYDSIPLDKEVLLSKIFESIGIKYNTVKNMISEG